MNIDTLAPRRQWILLVPICVHGLVLALVGIALSFIGISTSLDARAEQNRLRRAPTQEELARGERWFSGAIERLAVARTKDGSRPDKDPWDGCAIRRETYHSGKNSGWYDSGYAWAFGSAIISGEGQSIEVPLYSMSGWGTHSALPEDERVKALPDEPPTSTSIRYLRDCYAVGTSFTVNARVDANGTVAQYAPALHIARRETREQMLARISSDAAWSAIAPIAFIGTLAWFCFVISFFRQPFGLSQIFSGRALPAPRPYWARMLAITGGGFAFGLALYFVALPHLQVVIFPTAASLVFAYLWSWSSGLVALLGDVERLLAGEKLEGLSVSSGAVAPAEGRFDVVELFLVGSKNAIGAKVLTEPSHATLQVDSGDTHCTFDAKHADYFAPCDANIRRGEEIRQRARSVPPSFDRLWMRETTLAQGQEVTIVGRAEAVADATAPNEDYRAPGTSAFYRGDETRRTLVLAAPREVLLARARKDRKTARFLRGIFFAWLGSAVVVAAMAVKYKFFSP